MKYINFDGSGKSVAYVGICDKVVVDMGLKFVTLENKNFKVSTDRLATGQNEIKKKFLGVYAYFE